MNNLLLPKSGVAESALLWLTIWLFCLLRSLIYQFLFKLERLISRSQASQFCPEPHSSQSLPLLGEVCLGLSLLRVSDANDVSRSLTGYKTILLLSVSASLIVSPFVPLMHPATYFILLTMTPIINQFQQHEDSYRLGFCTSELAFLPFCLQIPM